MSVTKKNFNAGSQKIPITPFSETSEAFTGFKGKPGDSVRTSGLDNATMPKLTSPENGGMDSNQNFAAKDFNARRFKIRHVSLPR